MISRQIFICFLLLTVCFLGCGRKQADHQQDGESSEVELTLPQIPKISGPYKPTNKDIQIALKNVGLYQGEIDGTIGPLTKNAIQEFQKQNNLTVDGKVGPKTWAVLRPYLSRQLQGE